MLIRRLSSVAKYGTTRWRPGVLTALISAAAACLVLAPSAANAQSVRPSVSAATQTVSQRAHPALPGVARKPASSTSSCGWSSTTRATHLYQGSTAVALLPDCTGLYVLCYFDSTYAGNDPERDYVNWTSYTGYQYAGNVIDAYVNWGGRFASQVGYSHC